MNYRLFLFTCLFLLLCNLEAKAQYMKLSDQAEIKILTCGPYQGELYSAFGHSAIRVYDPVHKFDLLYNYGVFDFNQPNFYLNFARGYLNYRLAVMDYSRFRDFYIYYNRYIHEQVLNLTSAQEQQFFEFLQWNSRPENQYYYYDYFYDNCATRVRDALETTFEGQIEFDGSYIETDYTIRELTDLYLQHQPWGDLGIDLCLGMPMDKKATPYMYMYLPDYIESAFNHAVIKTDSAEIPLVKRTDITYESRPEELPVQLFTPLNVFIVLLLLGLVLTYQGWKKQRAYKGLDVMLFSIVGLIGVLLLLLWVATDHRAAANNLNVLWALPTHLPAAFLLLKKQKPGWLKNYFLISSVLGILLLIGWGLVPQQLHYALIPIVLLLAVRSFYIYRFQN